ncbi:hypothetical protein J4Q44_G00218580 [Coregonus suidteri]|uniref:Uncharacterized protein n=1 Tax=Coregonus suidteri TaxID=861788 RepID=A0AAN8R0Y9_9TELE
MVVDTFNSPPGGHVSVLPDVFPRLPPCESPPVVPDLMPLAAVEERERGLVVYGLVRTKRSMLNTMQATMTASGVKIL